MRFIDPKTGTESDSLYKMFGLDKQWKKVISFIGAGGKTTMIYQLAEELAAMGKRVIVTTSTHMKKSTENFVEWGVPFTVEKGQIITTGVSCSETKIQSFDLDSYAELSNKADIVLIEADGSRKMPLKVPASHEPVLVEGTDLVIGILGVNSVGKTIEEVSQRPADVAGVLGKDVKDLVTIEDLVTIGESEDGLHKGVVCDYKILLNQWIDQPVTKDGLYDIILCEKRKA